MSCATDVDLNPIKREDVLDFWDSLHADILSWEQQLTPMVDWNGIQVRPITLELENRLADLGVFLSQVAFEPDAWEVVLALDDFWAAVCGWAESIKQEESRADPSGGDTLWHHVGRITEAIREKYYKTLEPIEQLIRENVPQPQIAKIYGWVDSDGKPDVLKVQKEIREPGSQLDWSTWVHPDKLRRDRLIAERWVTRCRDFKPSDDPGAVFKVGDTEAKRRALYGDPESPEPIEALLRLEGISAAQIAKMKRLTVEQVYEIAAELRIPFDSHAIAMMSRGDTAGGRKAVESETRVTLLDIDTYPQIRSAMDRALAMASDGVRVGLILAALQDQHPGTTFDDITGWLGRTAENGRRSFAGGTVGNNEPAKAGDTTADDAGLEADNVPGCKL